MKKLTRPCESISKKASKSTEIKLRDANGA